MRKIAAMFGIMTALSGSRACADGFIMQLPNDGAWVLYEWESVGTFQGREHQGKGTLRISSVGHETVEEETCRWIEIEQGSGSRTNILKVLIPEKRLKPGQTPIDHVVRGWVRYAGKNKSQRLHHLGYKQGLFEILGSPLQHSQKLEPRRIDSGLGKLTCVGIRGGGVLEYKPHGTKGSLTATYWLHRKSPFGVVAGELHTSVTRGAPPQSGTRKFKLVKWGEGATSRLPDAK